MSYVRHRLKVDTDTGTVTLTSGPVQGGIMQVAWLPSVGDTGGDVALYLDTDVDDTGKAIAVLVESDVLGSGFTRHPRAPTHDVDGNPDMADTGTPQQPTEIVSAGDTMRAVITPGGASVVGDLLVWTKSEG